MANSRQKGKRVELQIAKRFGVERNKSDGTSHTDIHTPLYAIEVKARAELPDWMNGAMQQAVDDARGRIPIVVLVQTSPKVPRQEYVMLRLDDFLKEETP